MVLSSLAHYRGPLRPHHSPRRAAHRPASHSPRAAHRACLRLRRRYLRLMSKVRSRWGYALQCPPCPKLLGWCGWVRKIMQSFSLSRSPPILLSRDEPRCGPPATYNARRQEKPALPAAPFVALQISHHLPQPPTLLLSPRSLPSVRTLRLSLLHSQLPWVASLASPDSALAGSERASCVTLTTSGFCATPARKPAGQSCGTAPVPCSPPSRRLPSRPDSAAAASLPAAASPVSPDR